MTPRVMTEDEAKAYALRCDLDTSTVLEWRARVEKALSSGSTESTNEFCSWQRKLIRFGDEDEAALRVAEQECRDDPVIARWTVRGRKTCVRSLAAAKDGDGSMLVTDIDYSSQDYKLDHSFAGVRRDLEEIIESELPPLHGNLEGVDPFDIIRANLGAALKDGLEAWKAYLDDADIEERVAALVTPTTERAAFLLDKLTSLEANWHEGTSSGDGLCDWEHMLCRAIRLGELIERTKTLPYERFVKAGVRESAGGENSQISQRLPGYPTWAEAPEQIRAWARNLYESYYRRLNNKSEACRLVAACLEKRGYTVDWNYLRTKIFRK